MTAASLHKDSVEQLMLNYKRGILSRNLARSRLVTEFGLSEYLAEQMIVETDNTPLGMIERHVGTPADASAVSYERCTVCDGNRMVPFKVPGQMIRCPRCEGRGYVIVKVAL